MPYRGKLVTFKRINKWKADVMVAVLHNIAVLLVSIQSYVYL
jgi:hypothetical protein